MKTPPNPTIYLQSGSLRNRACPFQLCPVASPTAVSPSRPVSARGTSLLHFRTWPLWP